MRFTEISESTTAGSVASVAMPLGGTQKRAGSMFKGKKTKKKFYESEVSEAEVNEADLILMPGQLKGKDKSFIPHDKDRRDHEVEMARSDLYAAAKDAMRIYKMLKNRTEDEGLMGWQQSYITLASDYLNSVADSLEHQAATEGAGVIAGGMSNFEEAKRDQYTTRVDDEGNVVKVYPPSGPKTQKDYVKSLVKNLGSSHIGKRGESPRGDKVGKGANLKGSTVAKLSGGMSKVAEEKCPHCGGGMVSEELMNEKKDACYYKVKSRYKVWPSAYASGALVKCRKKGAKNWGNKSK
jgi:outer membrane murein-binding lipoprotein Lpp